MDSKEKQKLLVLIGIFAIAASVLYYNFLLKPQFSKFLVMNREFYAVKARIRDAESLILNKDRIKRQYDNLVKDSQLLEGRLPGQDEVSGLLGDFSNVAESSGVNILKIKPLDVLQNAVNAAQARMFYAEFPILIEARAGYHQCAIFINKLESMERLIKIDDVDIKSRSDDPRHHDIKLRISTYVVQ